MNDNCDNCYWNMGLCLRNGKSLPKENICINHSPRCFECRIKADYVYKKKYICKECIIRELDIKVESNPLYYDKEYNFLGDGQSLAVYLEKLHGIEKI